MLGLFIFSLALHFLASPAVRNQVKPVEKEAEVQHQRLAVLYSGIGVTLSSAVIGKKTLRSRVLRACGNVLDVVLLRQMLINKYTCTDSEIKKNTRICTDLAISYGSKRACEVVEEGGLCCCTWSLSGFF